MQESEIEKILILSLSLNRQYFCLGQGDHISGLSRIA